MANCPRCGARVCSAHAPPVSWCDVCERERQDDVQFAVMAATLKSPTMLDVDDQRGMGGTGIAFNAASVVIHAALRPWRKWRARRYAEHAFLRKPAEEIAAWRRTNLRDEVSG
jgi:hypothetical protein